MKFEKAFVTGCDSNTEWMLPWFLKNFREHSHLPLILCDFGMTPGYDKTLFDEVYDMSSHGGNKISWFLKPKAMADTSKFAKERFWIDTDCEIRHRPDDIFGYIEPNKLSIAVDRPWTRRRNAVWYNSGVFGVRDVPDILRNWEINCRVMNIPETPGLPPPGDQDVIHYMINSNAMLRLNIRELPNRYNVLRIQILDKDIPQEPSIIHWTGYKGKEHIRGLL